jgi:hypothetical protein
MKQELPKKQISGFQPALRAERGVEERIVEIYSLHAMPWLARSSQGWDIVQASLYKRIHFWTRDSALCSSSAKSTDALLGTAKRCLVLAKRPRRLSERSLTSLGRGEQGAQSDERPPHHAVSQPH